jgi:hypothetical protein
MNLSADRGGRSRRARRPRATLDFRRGRLRPGRQMTLRSFLRALVALLALPACGFLHGCRRTDTPRETLKPLWTVGSAKGGAGQPSFATLIWADFDPAGKIFALDHSDQRITRLTADGRVEAQFGGRGMGPGGLSKAQRFAWAGGRLYVANLGNGRIEVLGPSGEVFPSVQLADVADPGELYFARDTFFVERRFVPSGYTVYAYDRNWKLERGLGRSESVPNRVEVLRTHNTVCAAPDGVWIIYMLLNRIVKVGFDGKVLFETSRDLNFPIPKDKDGREIPEILIHRACAADPAGNLYVIYSNPDDWKRGNDVYEFGPDGHLRGKAFTLPIHNATFIRFDGQGNFYYSDGPTLTKARIERREGS